MLKYGMYAKAVELLCFKQALARLAQIYPDMDMKRYKRSVKREYKEMLLRTPDIGGSSLEMNLYIAAFVFSLHKAEPDRITPEVVDEMVTAVFDSPFMVKAHENKKCTLFTDNVQDKKVQESIASQTSKYELDWMLKMQDETSGGVYHKVTGEVFPEMVAAVEETAQMILSPISNTATGDFAAVMAKASVVYRKYDAAFADSCLAAAQKAWKYLEQHQGDAGFKNVGSIVTGEYPDSNDSDEYLWAAAELYIATGDESYNDYVKTAIEGSVKYGLGWADVGYYGIYDYCVNVKDCAAEKEILKKGADKLVDNYAGSGFGSTTGGSYVWGSNMVVADNGILLLMASKVLGDDSYVDYAADQLNYILGRNAVSYCYVTGYGSQTPENPHHRPSEALGKAMPGMLVGGADGNLEDPYAKAVLAKIPKERCYVDNAQSYSCNEVTIYWNSPLVYLLANFK